MKKLFTIFSMALGIAAQAQPEFNSLEPINPGQSIITYSKDGITLSPGNGGANQVWDFSDVTFSNNDATEFFFEDPSESDDAASFPTATTVGTSGFGDYIFYKLNSSENTALGYVSPFNNLTMIYSDPMTSVKTPLTYGASFTDEFSGSAELTQGYTIGESGSLTVKYDGYGTLKTIYGTYNNIVRLKETRVQTTDYPTFSTTETTTSYYYCVPGYSTPLFGIEESKLTTPVDETSNTAVYLNDPSFLTSNRNAYLQNLKLSVSPNPATDKLALDFKDLSSDDYTLKITEQTGAVVMENQIYAAKGDVYTMNIEGLKSGLYFLEVSSENGKAVKKIVKE